MADGYFPTLVSKDKDPNAVTNPLLVELSDGTTALGVTSGALDVNLTNTSVAVTGTFWQTTQPVSGTVTIQDGGNSITVDGSVAVSSVGGSVTVVDGGGSITVDGSVSVTASDLDIRNLTLTDDAVKVSANSTANSAANPIFVAFTSAAITGEVHSYNDASTTTTTNHDYTVSATMLVKSIECSASGGAKFELQCGPLAGLVSKWTGFVPKAGGTVSARFDPPIEVPVASTGTVRIIRTNRESQAQSIYTTIVGLDA
jgi:hypothetical protein